MRTLVLLGLTAALAAAPDLDRLLARWKTVKMPFDAAALDARERRMVEELAAASRDLDEIYWRQMDPEGLRLLGTTHDEKLRRLLVINGSRYDLIDGNRPFVAGAPPFYPGHAFYPRGLTREQIEGYVKAHPDQRAAIYDEHTVVRRRGSELVGVPYHVEYKRLLEDASRLLREAAGLSGDAAFASFLRLRAEALLTDNYYPSDLAWLELKQPRFDVIFAPYETYDDGVLGVKTSYGAAVLIRNQEETARLETFGRYVPELQEALPLAAADRPSKRGHASPMEVVDSPYRGGDLRHGYQAVADNLPNDPRIHAQKGSKKIFFKNFLDARVQYIIVPLARALMRADQAALVTPKAYLADTLLHEISHGLGPAYARVSGKQIDIREAIGPAYSGLEEAKADVVGLYGLKWLADHGVLTAGDLRAAYAAHVADLFRMLRFGPAEAHAVSEIMQFNYFVGEGAVKEGGGRYELDLGRMPGAVARLAKELLEIEASGDAGRARRWFERYRKAPAGLEGALGRAAGVPVDIDPAASR